MTDPKTLELLKDRSQNKRIEYFMSHEEFKGWEGNITQPILSAIYTAFGVSHMPKVYSGEDGKAGRPKKEMNGNGIKNNSSLDKYITVNSKKE